eukprot:UN19992
MVYFLWKIKTLEVQTVRLLFSNINYTILTFKINHESNVLLSSY